jgi:hypothetical protein
MLTSSGTGRELFFSNGKPLSSAFFGGFRLYSLLSTREMMVSDVVVTHRGWFSSLIAQNVKFGVCLRLEKLFFRRQI